MTRLALIAAAAATAATMFLAASATASPNVRYGVQDGAFLSAGPRLEERLATLDRLGAKLVRYMVNWRQIAPRKPRHPANPGDPAYDWSSADAVLGALHAHRIAVLATLYRTPAWASAKRRPRDVPKSSSSLAAFALAMARRYPWLRLWEVWNEPNLSSFLLPVSPRLYVQRLLNPTLVALHAANPANRVAGGNPLDQEVDWQPGPTAVEPPTTSLSRAAVKTGKGRASFAFSGGGLTRSYQCSLSRGHHAARFTACRAPESYIHLRAGHYTFRVRAVGPGGHDRTPAIRQFRIH